MKCELVLHNEMTEILNSMNKWKEIRTCKILLHKFNYYL